MWERGWMMLVELAKTFLWIPFFPPFTVMLSIAILGTILFSLPVAALLMLSWMLVLVTNNIVVRKLFAVTAVCKSKLF